MTHHWRWIGVVALALVGCTGEQTTGVTPETQDELRAADRARGRVVIANRASGSISVIDARTHDVTTYDLPDGEAPPEPMYVVYAARYDRVFVGDRANNRVVVFNDGSFDVETTVPAGNGVFHMWADTRARQLWVNNDIDNTMTVIDPRTLDILGTAELPADLVAMGGKPHDVVVGPSAEFAYVSVVGLSGDHDVVVQYDTATLTESDRVEVGQDPHLSLSEGHDRLYVPCQNTNEVMVLDRMTLEVLTSIPAPGAHGAAMARGGRFFYTTNLPGGGAGALYTIRTETNELAGPAVDTPFAVPHNLAVSPNRQQLFVTHSGATSDKVTSYRLVGKNRTPVFEAEITVGLNPFGLAFVN